MEHGPDMYQLNTFNITKMTVSVNGRVGGGRGRNQNKTPKKCHEIKNN